MLGGSSAKMSMFVLSVDGLPIRTRILFPDDDRRSSNKNWQHFFRQGDRRNSWAGKNLGEITSVLEQVCLNKKQWYFIGPCLSLLYSENKCFWRKKQYSCLFVLFTRFFPALIRIFFRYIDAYFRLRDAENMWWQSTVKDRVPPPPPLSPLSAHPMQASFNHFIHEVFFICAEWLISKKNSVKQGRKVW